MSEKLIGSLIYGHHVVPKKQRPLKQRIAIALAIGITLIAVCTGVYKFINFREENRVSAFLADIQSGNFSNAYERWDVSEGHYAMKEFMEDWGKDGYYGKTVASAKVSDSNSHGTAVIVYVKFEGFKAPIAFLVDKGTMKISFSTINKYVRTQRSVS